MLIFFAGPLHADPVITVMAGGDGGIALTAANVGVGPFVIDETGRLKLTFTNGSSITYLDLHIVISLPPNVAITGMGQPLFDDFIRTSSGVAFGVGDNGVGIGPGETIMIIFEGFPAGTVINEVSGTVTGEIPEPASLLLLGTGIAGVAIKARKKLKASRR